MLKLEKTLTQTQAELDYLESFFGPYPSAALQRGAQVRIQNRKRTVSEILEKMDVRYQVLDRQRKDRDTLQILRLFRRQTDWTRIHEMASKPKNLFYLLQRAFCAPEDYTDITPISSAEERRIRKNEVLMEQVHTERRARIFQSLVFDPGLISKEFLQKFLIPTSTNSIPETLQVIRELKKNLQSLHLINTSNKKASARICRIQDSKHPNHGKILIFQKLPHYTQNEIGRFYPTEKVAVELFNSIYSAIHGQEHSIHSLQNRELLVQELRKKLLHIKKQYESTDEHHQHHLLITETNLLKDSLEKSQNWHENRAYRQLGKIHGHHKEQDWQCFLSALSECLAAEREIHSKISTISERVDELKLAAQGERDHLVSFIERFFEEDTTYFPYEEKEFDPKREYSSRFIRSAQFFVEFVAVFSKESSSRSIAHVKPFSSIYEKIRKQLILLRQTEHTPLYIKHYFDLRKLLKDIVIFLYTPRNPEDE